MSADAANTQPRVLVVGAGPYQCDAIRSARRAGAWVLAVDGAADAPGLALADHGAVVDTRDLGGVVDLARRERVRAVLTAGSDAALPAVCAVVEALGLPGPRTSVLALTRDKLATHRALAAARLPVPDTCLAADSLAALRQQVLQRFGYPCVLKPATGAGGRGVTVIRSEAELDAALKCGRRVARDAPLLLQAFAPGTSVGVEACFFGGALVRAFALSDQYVAGFVSPVGHALPCALSASELATVHHAVSAWGRALGIDTGVVNFDTRLDGSTLWPLEVNLRPGGSSITELLRVSLGVDVSLAALRCALGVHPSEALTPNAQAVPAASRLVLVAAGGRRVVGARALPPAAQAKGVVYAERCAVGSAPPEVNGMGLAGRCLVHAASLDEALAAAATLAEALADSLVLEDDHARS